MEELKQATKDVSRLFDDPQLGLSMWNAALRDSCIDMQKALCSLGATPEACGIK